MSFCIRIAASAKKEILRIGQEEFAEMAKEIGGDRPDIHSTRKTIKRLRALVSLTSSAAKPARVSKLDKRLRAVARKLSSQRDAAVRTQTLAAMQKRYKLGELTSNVALIASKIDTDHHIDTETITAEVEDIKRLFTALPNRSLDISTLIDATSRDYRDGRRYLQKLDPASDADDLHEMRKYVQRQWRHMLLLEDIWPKEMTARAKLAKQVSELLGTDHDLAVLQLWLREQDPGVVAKKETTGLCALAIAWQKELRAEALPLADKLYAEPWRSLRRRLRQYAFATMAIPRRSKPPTENEIVSSQHIVHLQRRV
jgi:CHAD domain-containing protein